MLAAFKILPPGLFFAPQQFRTRLFTHSEVNRSKRILPRGRSDALFRNGKGSPRKLYLCPIAISNEMGKIKTISWAKSAGCYREYVSNLPSNAQMTTGTLNGEKLIMRKTRKSAVSQLFRLLMRLMDRDVVLV
jgi:hypothetical protein